MDVWMTIFVSLLTGGVGLKLAEHILTRGEKKFDQTTKIQDEARELRNEIKSELAYVRDMVRGQQLEIDGWKEKYYGLLSTNIAISKELNKISNQYLDLKKKYNFLLGLIQEIETKFDLEVNIPYEVLVDKEILMKEGNGTVSGEGEKK